MNNLRIETVDIASLIYDPENARLHSIRNLDAITGSLRLFGQRKPIVVTKGNIVVAGNGTLEAATKLGWSEISIVRTPDDWTPEQIKAYALADNRTAELAEWETELLNTQLEELKEYGYQLDDLGFEELQDPTRKEIEEFKEFDEDLPVDFKCPKCNYEWSGKQN